MLRRNPYSINNEAKYLQSVLINAIAGYPLERHDQERLLSFLERVISTTAQAPAISPFKTYSSSKQDPFLLPEKPKPLTPPSSIAIPQKSDANLNRIERKARLGDQTAILDYLQILDYQGHIELENLWIVPFNATPWTSDEPDDWYFIQAFPYTLGMNLQNVENFIKKHDIPTYRPLEGAFVVDIGSLEVSDILHKRLQVTFDLREIDEKNIASTAKFFLLQAEAILIIGRDGWRFPKTYEVGILDKYDRQSSKYWQILHKYNHPGKTFKNAGPIKTRWPERRIKQLAIAQFPNRERDIPYVIVVHKPSYRAFALGGNYHLIDADVDDATVLHAMKYHKQADNWIPSFPEQRPDWANKLVDSGDSTNFIAFWVAE